MQCCEAGAAAHICAVERVVPHRIGSHFNNYKDPHTISAVLAVFCACSATELAVDLALGAHDLESGAERPTRETDGGRPRDTRSLALIRQQNFR